MKNLFILIVFLLFVGCISFGVKLLLMLLMLISVLLVVVG